jgi:hypothetical protein
VRGAYERPKFVHTTCGGQKEGRRASTAPLPPASKAPQRLALPPGSLVCNGRRKGDRRGAVVAMREAMALHAVRPEAVELPPVPAGLPRPDALGRDRPLMDGAPALDAFARRHWEVSAATLAPREACRACGASGANARPEKAKSVDRTAVPFRGCQDGSSLSLRIPDPVGPWGRPAGPGSNIDALGPPYQLFSPGRRRRDTRAWSRMPAATMLDSRNQPTDREVRSRCSQHSYTSR